MHHIRLPKRLLSTALAAALDVMKGTGNNNFSPKATYTRQQSFMTAYRLMTQIVEAE